MGEVHETVFGGNFAPQRKVALLPYAAASILTAWHGAHERVLYEGLCEMETLLIEGSSTEFSEDMHHKVVELPTCASAPC